MKFTSIIVFKVIFLTGIVYVSNCWYPFEFFFDFFDEFYDFFSYSFYSIVFGLNDKK